ncbi:unnamed protein product [Effrenium voratum]|uniref:Phosphatidic acid phosphatase type 2/haloperoxidase domain-containing protein n=1 Tax=Effrenium voratum TaxID=2562239 RepID=A0AA36JNQ0_9DINO|nr:unnamed protein product [Effrenium voratum]CAJ1439196.1 unnamed protein product [Effrenium voratum]CAJ1443418.1 unnamed protein product [Effrenium voratum]
MASNLWTLCGWAFGTSIPAGVALLGACASGQVLWLWTGLGAVLLDCNCLALKGYLRHPRPREDPPFVLPSEGPYGMPSEHTAFAGFLVTQLALRAKFDGWRPCSPLLSQLFAFLLGIWALGMALVRFHVGAHSAVQLAAGYFFGVGFGLLWRHLQRRLNTSLCSLQHMADVALRCAHVLYGEGEERRR